MTRHPGRPSIVCHVKPRPFTRRRVVAFTRITEHCTSLYSLISKPQYSIMKISALVRFMMKYSLNTTASRAATAAADGAGAVLLPTGSETKYLVARTMVGFNGKNVVQSLMQLFLPPPLHWCYRCCCCCHTTIVVTAADNNMELDGRGTTTTEPGWKMDMLKFFITHLAKLHGSR